MERIQPSVQDMHALEMDTYLQCSERVLVYVLVI